MNNTQLSDAFAQAVVRAQMAVEELAERHIEATERLATVRARIDEIETERARLTAARKPGEPVSDETAGRVFLLNQDLEALRPLLVEASNEEAAINADLAVARGQLAAAEGNWRRHQDETLLSNLKQRAAEVEQLLFDILADIEQVGARIGRPRLVQNWSASSGLRNLVSAGWLPPRGR